MKTEMIILGFVMFALTVASAWAVTIDEDVTLKPSAINVTYQIQNKTNFEQVILTNTTLSDGTVDMNTSGNVIVRIIAFGSSNVDTNISSSQMINFSFSGIDSDLFFFKENSFGTVKFNDLDFMISLVESWEKLYTNTTANATTTTTTTVGGGGYQSETHLGEITVNLNKPECEINGYYYYDDNCFKCNGDIILRDNLYYCFECQPGFKWDGDRCLLDEENFNLNEWAGNNSDVVRLGGFIIAAGLSIIGFMGKAGDNVEIN